LQRCDVLAVGGSCPSEQNCAYKSQDAGAPADCGDMPRLDDGVLFEESSEQRYKERARSRKEQADGRHRPFELPLEQFLKSILRLGRLRSGQVEDIAYLKRPHRLDAIERRSFLRTRLRRFRYRVRLSRKSVPSGGIKTMPGMGLRFIPCDRDQSF
jgi:hypothetical protein